MSDVPAIDAMIDQAVCHIRDMPSLPLEEVRSFFQGLVDARPELACVAATYHLGGLVMARNTCLREESELDG